jgi:CRP/FNR family transcriptional regulator
MLKNFYGLKADGKTLDISLSREDLSNLVGTATESLIRMLAEFKADKLIDLQDRQILLLNIPKLTNVAKIQD